MENNRRVINENTCFIEQVKWEDGGIESYELFGEDSLQRTLKVTEELSNGKTIAIFKIFPHEQKADSSVVRQNDGRTSDQDNWPF